jgi:hypothetical protein
MQLDLEGEAAARAVEHANPVPAWPGFQDADPPILDARNGLAIELQVPIGQAG